MEHSFDVEIASKYGILEAILIKNIYYWIQKNKANDKHFYNGRYWTYNSVKAFQELFPYASIKKIRNALDRLEEKEIILKGNYNQNTYDRTLWYALTDEGLALIQGEKIGQMEVTKRANGSDQKEECEYPKGQMDMSKKANGYVPEGEPIPNNKPYSKTDVLENNNVQAEPAQSKKAQKKKEANELFEKLWSLYPNKKGKGQVSDTAKLKLLKIGADELLRALERYKVELEKDASWRKPQNGSTFFNSGYIDYLDANYVPGETKQPQKQKNKPNSFHNFEQRQYDYGALEEAFIGKANGLV